MSQRTLIQPILSITINFNIDIVKNNRDKLKNYCDELTRQSLILEKGNDISGSLFSSLEFRLGFFNKHEVNKV